MGGNGVLTFLFGPVTVEIRGETKVYRAVMHDFERLPAALNNPDIVFDIVASEDSLESPAYNGLLRQKGTLTPVGGLFDTVLLEHVQSGKDAFVVRCRQRFTPRRRLATLLPGFVQKMLSMYFVTLDELYALLFLYEVFLWSVQIALLSKGASLIHASSILNLDRDETVLTVGWGGVGKTSLEAYAFLKHPEKMAFLADDVSILGSDGIVWLNPMGAHIYPYNTQGFPELWQRIARHMTTLSKLHWRIRESLYGSGGVVRRINPYDLWETTAPAAVLTTALYLERYPGFKPQVREMDLGFFIARAQHVLLWELRAGWPILLRANATRSREFLPPVELYVQRIRQVYAGALMGKRLLHILVPNEFDPKMLGDFIFAELGWASA